MKPQLSLLLSPAPLLAACVNAPDVAPPAPATADGPIALELTLQEDPLLVLAAVSFPGDDDGETVVFETESWGGVGPDREDLEAVRFTTADGAELAHERVDAHHWKVTHPPGARLVAHAVLPANDEDRRASFESGSYYRPILEPGLLHAIGNLFLLLPEHLNWKAPRELSLTYRGFEEAGWEVVDSFGSGAGPRTAQATLSEFNHALFVAGDLDVQHRLAAGGPLVVALAGDGWSFDGSELADLTARIVGLERELMGDAAAGHYLVTAIAVGPESRGLSFGGTGLTNSFALFLQPNVSIALDSEGGLPIRRLLAHECFHEWNGMRIRLAQPEEPSYWFSEGFTDYFARRVLFEAGWLGEEEYADSLSELLTRYHMSPMRNHTAAELGESFWTDRDAQQQPYIRGDVVACLLDHELRRASGGTNDLWALMRELLEECETTGAELDAEGLLARFEHHVGSEAAERIRRIVLDGDTAELPADAFGPDYVVGEQEVYAWDPGFDVEASIESMETTGVRPDSPAAQAGLSDGMALAGVSIYYDDPDREIELTLAGTGAETIAYLPRGAATSVPAVRVRREAP
ncbi:MAG: hypothetical protein AAF682_07510 [Planctomycetota bacterium]